MNNIRTADGIIEAAYEAGFEPSSENITLFLLHEEAMEFLTNAEVRN